MATVRADRRQRGLLYNVNERTPHFSDETRWPGTEDKKEKIIYGALRLQPL